MVNRSIFLTFKPKKNQINLVFKLPKTAESDAKIESAGFDALEYNKKWGLYRLRLTKAELNENSNILSELVQLAYERRVG